MRCRIYINGHAEPDHTETGSFGTLTLTFGADENTPNPRAVLRGILDGRNVHSEIALPPGETTIEICFDRDG